MTRSSTKLARGAKPEADSTILRANPAGLLGDVPSHTKKDSEAPIVLGVDGGIANFGLSAVELHADYEVPIDLYVIRTEKSAKKQGTLAADDNARRASEIGRALLSLPYLKRIRAICYEAQSMPRNASAAAKTALSLGVLIQFAEERGLPLRAVSPQALKKTLTGAATASKEEVEDALMIRYGFRREYATIAAVNASPMMTRFRKLPRGVHEHAWDALGAIVACLDTDVIRAIRPRA